jgi:hypothetical protein
MLKKNAKEIFHQNFLVVPPTHPPQLDAQASCCRTTRKIAKRIDKGLFQVHQRIEVDGMPYA